MTSCHIAVTAPTVGSLGDEVHFFLQCTAYAAVRNYFLANLGHLLPQYGGLLAHLDTRKQLKEIIKIIINGTRREQLDFKMFVVLSMYITKTKRF